jgi:hypothetical protein
VKTFASAYWEYVKLGNKISMAEYRDTIWNIENSRSTKDAATVDTINIFPPLHPVAPAPRVITKDEEIPELNKNFEFHDVSTKTELKAAFLGDEDQMVIEYLKRCPNPRGVTLSHLILYFCYRYGLISQRRLMNRIKHLIKMELISVKEESGLNFYKPIIK